jgi:DNA-directed RNA polymerase subunit RPC12/RpoP
MAPQVADPKRAVTCPYCHRALLYTHEDLQNFEEPGWLFERTVIGIVCPACGGRIVLRR